MTFAEAARRLGHKSRSTLYRLKAEDRLVHYLVEGPNGSHLLEMAPEGRPTLEAFLAAVLDPGRGPQASRRDRRSQVDRRWEILAANLSAVLEEIGGPSLTGKEAELLAARFGAATWEVFPDGLPGGPPESAPHPQGDGTTILDLLWNPLAKEGNQALVEAGWRFPRLRGQEVLLVWQVAEAWMEGTSWDTESLAWWEEAMADSDPEDPDRDPWRCEWCGKPWHHHHPDYQPSPASVASREALLERLGMSRDVPEEACQDPEESDPSGA